MFIVKLHRDHMIQLRQADEVNIYAVGPREGCAPEVKDRTTDVIEIAICRGDYNAAFYITDRSKPKPKGWAETCEFYDIAYVENERGATTEIVKPY